MDRRLLVWWYAAIALGFLLLALRAALLKAHPWLVGLRLLIAAGFAVLAWLESRGRRR